MLSNGTPRAADIIRRVDGAEWVFVASRPRGISTFDRPGVPPGRGWDYYCCIPAGTLLPERLTVVRDNCNETYGSRHYTIAPAHDMPLARFRALLDQLALVRRTA